MSWTRLLQASQNFPEKAHAYLMKDLDKHPFKHTQDKEALKKQ